ncbi:MAG: molybdate ABC transporter substrate-binding protein [Candidatus Nitricoxidivorans perseverans]|uniref:Molybdate ABC transporter substrate-binding protein n=1 Tax=Candidatus Nitricoxidivorans perseverans TaxID=2975601 RepID=A0AA49J086_9PROT|nr:MAG: molybdate ABC transporter substrate-binding protein [Candidatus Nitricoxidivorans perseverans]
MHSLSGLFLLLALGLSYEAKADQVLVAVASNFADVVKDLAPKFQAETGHTLKASFGASGKFAAQIENGAPFDLFLSADADLPRMLEERGLGVKKTRFVYATGKLALWNPTRGYVDAKGEVLKKNRFARIAIANPKTAPYGRAAVETMRKLGIGALVGPKIVQGENVAQTFQFVETGNAELGFIAMSQVLALDDAKRGSYWEVPAALHSVISQDAILLKRGQDNPGATAFMKFLRSPAAKSIIIRYGYGV